MIAGFERPDKGAIRIDGVERIGPSRNGIMISQHGSVFPWLTVHENLMFALSGTSHADQAVLANRYIEMVGLEGFEGAYPHELSGGMLKRAEIARALVVKPEILYMDEPFSALDALMSLRMQTELRRILEEERHTVLLITHDVEEAIYLADRILVLSPRPTTIQTTFHVDLAHPRKLSDPKAQTLREAILKELGL
jgi:ABC-type nitrate/sulfonate/bicarbonate transport system ATPase subunit